MRSRIISLRLTDMLNAIVRIRRILNGIPLEEFEEDGDKRWLVERASRSSRKQAATFRRWCKRPRARRPVLCSRLTESGRTLA